MYLAWRYGGEDPYRLYNDLDKSYRPVGRFDVDPRPPLHPRRVRNVIYGFALTAERDEIAKMRISSSSAMAGG